MTLLQFHKQRAMHIPKLAAIVLGFSCVSLVSCPAAEEVTMQSSQEAAPWRREVILWQMQLPNDSDWRRHESLQGKFHAEYPDDLEVLFRDAATEKYERMWVTVIAYHPPSREYLGVLLNSPDLVHTIQEGDNVAFRLVDGVPYPVAVDMAGDYRRAGLPTMSPPALFDAVAQALSQYRRGNFGHNPAGIEAAIAHFRRCQTLVTDDTEEAAKFFLHFFLGRCFAEKYETLAAVAEFERAISLRPDDEDAQMGLLAELSVLAHTPKAKLPSGDPETWARRFEVQVASVRGRFPRDAHSNKMIDELLSSSIADLTGEAADFTPEELARMRRIGAGTFRWKVK